MEELIVQYPRSAWVDDARFGPVTTYEKLGQSLEKAFQCYQDFIRAYPDSEWVKDAKADMVRLSHTLAKAGKPEYETIIKSFQSGGEDEDIRMTALYALQNIGDEEALKTIISLYDKADSRSSKARSSSCSRTWRPRPRSLSWRRSPARSRTRTSGEPLLFRRRRPRR